MFQYNYNIQEKPIQLSYAELKRIEHSDEWRMLFDHPLATALLERRGCISSLSMGIKAMLVKSDLPRWVLCNGFIVFHCFTGMQKFERKSGQH